jgi:MFS-type transporter involved in bile tolerance (Atg22 family)
MASRLSLGLLRGSTAIDNITGDMRNSILMLMVFFICGIGILYFLPTDKLKSAKTT